MICIEVKIWKNAISVPEAQFRGYCNIICTICGKISADVPDWPETGQNGKDKKLQKRKNDEDKIQNQTKGADRKYMVRATTKYGTIKGRKKEGFLTFRGIPYARPPVGDLRFRPPQEPEPWDGIRDCTSFGPPALQLFAVSHVPQANILQSSSEDCLYLNVSTPAFSECGGISGGTDFVPDAEAKLPVYIFIHGGAYETGGGNMPLYRGERFAENGIVYVNINYRMNAFGFFALEEFERESGSTGNFGILDALCAVRWVHENIEVFGGDPDNITVGGESAGAFTTSILMGLKSAKGLFRRCILESGSILGVARVARYGAGHPVLLKEASRQIAAELGVSDSPEGVKKLRSLPAKDLIRAWFFRPDGTHRQVRSDPMLDGLLFQGDLIPNPRVQYLNDVDLLFGFNTDEGTIFADKKMTEEDYRAEVSRIFGAQAPEILERYPVDFSHTPFERMADFIGLSSFKAAMLPYADILSARGKKVYGYHFACLTERLKKEGFGCRHIAELNFVFQRDLSFVGGDNEQGRAISDFMHRSWCNFIRTGNPGPEWPAYREKEEMLLKIGERQEAEKLPRKEELRYFEKILLREEGEA